MSLLYTLTGSSSSDLLPLYGFLGKDKIRVRKNESMLLDCYFNFFYTEDWISLTTIRNLSLHIQGKGKGIIELYAVLEEKGISFEKKIATQILEKNYYNIHLPLPTDWASYKVLYPKVIAQSQTMEVQLAYHSLDPPNFEKHKIGIVICTYNKPEYIYRTISNLLRFQSNSLHLEICVVDNARNLDSGFFKKNGVTLIPNPNSGGSGGFTRGMLHFSESVDISHILLMDDDIELDERVFERLDSLLRYRKEPDLCIGGTMLDSFRKTFAYETSASVLCNQLKYKPYNYSLDLTSKGSILQIADREPMEYLAWWFFVFPRKILSKLGFSYPFFIRMDDVEFSYRLSRNGYKLERMNGLAIWHEPFYRKDLPWMLYYTVRNILITADLYQKGNRFKIFLRFWIVYLIHSNLFWYQQLEYLLLAISDYLKGPKFLESLDPEEFHAQLVQKTKQDKDLEEISIVRIWKINRQAQKRNTIIKLLQIFIKRNFFFLNSKTLLEYSIPRSQIRKSHKNSKRSFAIFRNLLTASFSYLLFSRSLKRSWQESHKRMVSREFWENYLQLIPPKSTVAKQEFS